MCGLFPKPGSGSPWLFVGLGNPGPDYARHRHTVGFMAIDAIAARHGFSDYRAKFRGQIAEGLIGGEKVLALKPQTFMNVSGESVAAAARFYKISAERIVVFHDELDLAALCVRVKRGGGNAGHNGLKSIDAHLGTPDYWRVRIGIGHPGERDKVHGYVLSDFPKAQAEDLEHLLGALSDHASLLVEGKSNDLIARLNDKNGKQP